MRISNVEFMVIIPDLSVMIKPSARLHLTLHIYHSQLWSGDCSYIDIDGTRLPNHFSELINITFYNNLIQTSCCVWCVTQQGTDRRWARIKYLLFMIKLLHQIKGIKTLINVNPVPATNFSTSSTVLSLLILLLDSLIVFPFKHHKTGVDQRE